MATANLTVPIIIDWKAIEEYLAQHDIVEVVRCKDCIYNPQICFIGCPVDVPVDGDFFCAKGKRRNDERSD